MIFWSIKIAIYKGKTTKKGTHNIKNQKVFKIDFIKISEVFRENFLDEVKKLEELQTYLDNCCPKDDYSCGMICYNSEE